MLTEKKHFLAEDWAKEQTKMFLIAFLATGRVLIRMGKMPQNNPKHLAATKVLKEGTFTCEE